MSEQFNTQNQHFAERLKSTASTGAVQKVFHLLWNDSFINVMTELFVLQIANRTSSIFRKNRGFKRFLQHCLHYRNIVHIILTFKKMKHIKLTKITAA